MQSKSENRAVKEKQKASSDERVLVKRQSKRIVSMEYQQQRRKNSKGSKHKTTELNKQG